MTNNTENKIPPLVEIPDIERKKIVLGIKDVLSRLQEDGSVNKNKTYAEILGNPDELYEFIKTYKENRNKCSDIVLDKEGKPVLDDETELPCGVSLAQICQMLVLTVAKRQFKESEKKGKLTRLTPYLAFDWQLPLIKAYDFLLKDEHVAFLGEDILLLLNRKSIEAVASQDASKISLSKEKLKERFREMIVECPEAMSGIVLCHKDIYKVLEKTLQNELWRFFSRDERFLRNAFDLDTPLIKAFGSSLAYASDDIFVRLQKLSTEKAVILIERFKKDYPKYFNVLISDPDFLGSVFKTVIEYLYVVEGDDKIFSEIVRLKMNALKEVILMWLKSKGFSV